MKTLHRLHFLIHGFCHAESAFRKAPADGAASPYLPRENRCAAQWRSAVRNFAEDEALAILTWSHGPTGPAAEFEALAADALGDRCFVLDTPYSSEERFWDDHDPAFLEAVARDTGAILVHEWAGWNREELGTALHSIAAARQLAAQLAERGYSFDPVGLQADAWGASFDGCVTKYSLHLRRLLGLAQPIDIRFDLTTPDALFLLDATLVETVALAGEVRLFLFRSAEGLIALYGKAGTSPGEPPIYAAIGMDAASVTVRSKQGIRLWPEPEPYHLPSAGIGFYEPPQQVVRVEEGRLLAPVTTGFVYRLAKAPAYLFAAPGMPYDVWRDALASA